jgi:putative ABC transport system substrate-binding protein
MDERSQGRRRFLKASLAVAGIGLAAACSLPPPPWQQTPTTPRIGYLGPGTTGPYPMFLDAFRQGLRDLGYVEGQNIAVEYRFTDTGLERAPEFAADLVGRNVDLIVTTGAEATIIARDATTTIRIVGAVLGGDPIGDGLVASLARPGGNVPGMSAVTSGHNLFAKRLQLLREVIPTMTRVAVLLTPVLNKVPAFQEVQSVAPWFGVQVVTAEIWRASDLDAAFQTVVESAADALMPFQDPLTASHSARIVGFATERRLPAIYEVRLWTDAGGLMHYGIDSVTLFYRAATYVDRILNGAKPADLPVEQPTQFEFVINLKAARAIGLTIPPSVLSQATATIQ